MVGPVAPVDDEPVDPVEAIPVAPVEPVDCRYSMQVFLYQQICHSN